MTEQQQTPPPAQPANATEAQIQINALTADRAWVDRFMGGDLTAKKEFESVAGVAVDGSSAADVVAAAMSSKLPEFGNSEERQMATVVDQFRGIGIRDEVTKQFLSGEQVTPQEYELVANLKRELMGDPEFVKSYLGGNVKAQQRMTTINAVLVNGMKLESAS